MEAARPTTPSTPQEWETLSKEGKLPTTSLSKAGSTFATEEGEEEEEAEVDILLKPFEQIGADMVVSDSFSLPALSDDDNSDDESQGPLNSPEARGPNPAVQGRSLKAAARTTSGTMRLTDGFGDFKAAVPGLRTVRRTRAEPLSMEAVAAMGRDEGDDDDEGPMEEDDAMNDDERADVRRRVRKQQLRAEAAAVEVMPVHPSSLPPRLQLAPTGQGPPFVHTPGAYESVAESEIRTTSILEDDELDKVRFARPRPASQWPEARASHDSSRVLGHAYAGPGARSNITTPPEITPMTTAEMVCLGELRGTPFAPFSVQQGVPRPDGVTWDAPWDRTQRNVVAKRLWRVPGHDCDRTPLPTTKQGHRPRILGQHEQHANLQRPSSSSQHHPRRVTAAMSTQDGGGGGFTRSFNSSPITTQRPTTTLSSATRNDYGGGQNRSQQILTSSGLYSRRQSLSSPQQQPSASSASLADGTGIVGGAGRRGGTAGATPWTSPLSTLKKTQSTGSTINHSKPPSKASSLPQASAMHEFAPYAPLSQHPLPPPRAHISGTTDGIGPQDHVDHILHGGAGATAGLSAQDPEGRYTPGVSGSVNEFVVHDDLLSHLQPQVLQLLNEKNIALKLWPPHRSDVRMMVRRKFESPNDRFRDSPFVGTKLLGDRVIAQGLDSVFYPHPTDEVDALNPRSLVQTSRRVAQKPSSATATATAARASSLPAASSSSPPAAAPTSSTSSSGYDFPVPSWDGTTRNVTAQIGLWRDPGYDLHPPKGDARAERRRHSPSLQNA